MLQVNQKDDGKRRYEIEDGAGKQDAPSGGVLGRDKCKKGDLKNRQGYGNSL
ncbi:uncharacterized protein PFLUO_LOCUS7429 [Penicillium psychrofluorescens]|uniref:uncharacterized protein n=1 Tax=Penicillium psychrofluorescens TaxID=3158075 RepID=UPI003CCD964F